MNWTETQWSMEDKMWWRKSTQQHADIEATFAPRRDITANELATIIEKTFMPLRSTRFTNSQWHDLPPSIRRHFEEVEK